jgi:protein SCO1/2
MSHTPISKQYLRPLLSSVLIAMTVATAASAVYAWVVWFSSTRQDGAAERLFDREWMAPAFALPDQRGRTLTSAELSGHVWIADFIFTRCTAICPLLTERMRTLQQKLKSPELRFVSFSVDPEYDSVEVLRQYAAYWAPRETRWHLLRTEPASLRDVLDGMRVVARHARETNTIIHTSLFFLVDQTGHVHGMYDSDDERALRRLKTDADQLARAELAQKRR